MQINPHSPPPYTSPHEHPSWKSFYSKFSGEVSLKEKQAILEHFVMHLSHEIRKHLQRMINNYKKMRR